MLKWPLRTLLATLMIAAAAGTACAADVLRICGAPIPPYSYLENDAPAGIDVDVAKAVFGALGIVSSIEIEPFARCQHDLQTGAADVGFAVSDMLDRRTYLYFPTNWVWKISYVFFTNVETSRRLTIHGLDDAKAHDLRVGIVRGASYFPEFWTVYPGQSASINEGYNAALVPAADSAANFHDLAANHVQLFPQDRLAGLWAARQAGYGTPDYFPTVLSIKNYPNAFSRASKFQSERYPDIEALMQAYDVQLGKFKATARYRELVSRMP